MELKIEIAGVKLGVVEADGVRVEPCAGECLREVEEVCARLQRELTLDSIARLEAVRLVREMFRGWGVDPLRYRPSSEALLRRVVQGKELYRISNVVDLNNLGSCETAWSYGSYDRGQVRSPVALRLGGAGESYEAIGKQIWSVEGRPILTDAAGPFGSPISDSTRTMVTEGSTEILTVVFAPAKTAEAKLLLHLERHAERLTRFAGATATRTSVIVR